MPAPVVTDPTNQAATQGEQATFTVSATGDGPFTYQWYEGTLGYLLDEGEDTLIVDALLMNDGNGYFCIVTDINDLQTQSASAILTVNPASTIAPVIIGPEDKVVNAGDTVSMNVTANGAGPFTYQWYLATGGLLAGETSRTLSFVSKPVDNGKGYKCVVTDVSGLVTSSRIAGLEVIGSSAKGKAKIDYPCHLPGVLVNSNGYQSSERVANNPLSSGAPLFGLKDDDGYELFDVAWSFDAAELQSFRNWYRFTTTSGSRLFNIELWVDGYDGIKQTRIHECYFLGTPHPVQNGRRWHVSATLLAIEEKGTDKCLYTGPPLDLSEVFPELPDPIVPAEPRPECTLYGCSNYTEYLGTIPNAYVYKPSKFGDPNTDGASWDADANEVFYPGTGQVAEGPTQYVGGSNAALATMYQRDSASQHLLDNCPGILVGNLNSWGFFNLTDAGRAFFGKRIANGVLIDCSPGQLAGDYHYCEMFWDVDDGSGFDRNIGAQVQITYNRTITSGNYYGRYVDIQVIPGGTSPPPAPDEQLDVYRIELDPLNKVPVFFGVEMEVTGGGQNRSLKVDIYAGMGAVTPLATEGLIYSRTFANLTLFPTTSDVPKSTRPLQSKYFQDSFWVAGGMPEATWDALITYGKTNIDTYVPPGDCP